MTTQLRRYEIEDGKLDYFIEWFPSLVPVREQYGFTVNFAYADRDTNQFIWSVSHDGDFAAAERQYVASPERAAAFDGFDDPLTAMYVAMVDVIV